MTNEEIRLQPGGSEAIAAMRRIAETMMAEEINLVLIDAPSAALTVLVFDHLNEANQAQMLAFPVAMMAEVAWELANSVEFKTSY